MFWAIFAAYILKKLNLILRALKLMSLEYFEYCPPFVQCNAPLVFNRINIVRYISP